jgi:hypothetical protein
MTSELGAPAKDVNAGGGRRVAAAAVIYFFMVFAVGLTLGPIRVVWLEPVLGPTLAVLCETPFLLGAMAFAVRRASRWARLRPSALNHLGFGLLALLFQQVADLGVGFGLRGMTLGEQMALFTTPAGWIYAFNLLAFALAPIVLLRGVGKRRGAATGG